MNNDDSGGRDGGGDVGDNNDDDDDDDDDDDNEDATTTTMTMMTIRADLVLKQWLLIGPAQGVVVDVEPTNQARGNQNHPPESSEHTPGRRTGQ